MARVSIKLVEIVRRWVPGGPYDGGGHEVSEESLSISSVTLDGSEDGVVKLSAEECRRVARLLRSLAGGE